MFFVQLMGTMSFQALIQCHTCKIYAHDNIQNANTLNDIQRMIFKKMPGVALHIFTTFTASNQITIHNLKKKMKRQSSGIKSHDSLAAYFDHTTFLTIEKSRVKLKSSNISPIKLVLKLAKMCSNEIFQKT